MASERFEWDPFKEAENRLKHGVSFAEAIPACQDRRRLILLDVTHSAATEQRWFCLGRVGGGVMTVRFTWREGRIRIIGAGYWRKERRIYERQNQIH